MPKTDSSAGRPRRSYQKLTERLRQFMEEGHFRDGDKLPPERALAESFGVSRSSVREAIRALAEKGLLESRQGDGTYDRLKIIACDQQRRLLVGENDGDLDARFHLALAECTGNKLLIDTVARLNRIYAKGRTPELRDTPWRQFSVSSHLRIIDALERRSPEDSRKALEEHIDTVIHKHLFATVRD